MPLPSSAVEGGAKVLGHPVHRICNMYIGCDVYIQLL